MISNTRILKPTLVNEFRATHVGFANSDEAFLANVRNLVAELNIPGFAPVPAAWAVPNLPINTFSSFGDATGGPFLLNNHFFQFVDNIAWVKGKHSLRFGGEVRRDRMNLVGAHGAHGMFNFTGFATENPARPPGYSAGTGTAMADSLQGYTQNAIRSAGLGFAQFRSTAQNYYIDDSWKIHPKFVLNFGLRYENLPPPYDKSQHSTNIALSSQPPAGTINVADHSLHPTLVRIGQ